MSSVLKINAHQKLSTKVPENVVTTLTRLTYDALQSNQMSLAQLLGMAIIEAQALVQSSTPAKKIKIVNLDER